ncbi:MAG: hypothetical protein ACJASM_002932 [Salibacteraceae bacterium]|jgi:hypothetical protein
MLEQINQIIERGEAELPHLPSFHNTRSYLFREICDTNQIHPTPCSVFDEDIAYFFYGKPSYRAVADQKNPDKSFSSNRHLPVCIAVDSSVLELERIFPFDSGGFEKGIYFPHLEGDDYTLESFNLGKDSILPMKLVATFFGTNNNYIEGEIRSDVGFLSFFEFELEDYLNLIKAKNQNGDDRRSSIELQTKNSVVLDRNSVFAVTLPLSALSNQSILAKIVGEWGAIPITHRIKGVKALIKQALNDRFEL